MRLVALLLAALLAAPALAENREVELVGLERGKTYRLTVHPDGSMTLVPFALERVVVQGTPQPPTNPPTNPQPDTPLQNEVKRLTRASISAGGKPDTAAKLAAVYAILSDECLAGRLSPELIRGTSATPGLLSRATDEVLKDLPDKGFWSPWREGVGAALAARHPTNPSKEDMAATLREVSSAIKAHLGQQVAAGILDGINWQFILDLIKPIIQELVTRWLEELLKPK